MGGPGRKLAVQCGGWRGARRGGAPGHHALVTMVPEII